MKSAIVQIRSYLKHPLIMPVLYFVMCLQSETIRSQDVHFSQFYAAPLLLNPANTGMAEEDLRITANYRNQWAKIGSPYETTSTSIEKRMVINDQAFGIGAVILHDQSSSFNLSANDFFFSLSYSRIIKNQQLFFGIQPGFVMKSFNPDGLTFGSQFDQSLELFNSALPNLESGMTGRVNYFDLNVGIYWRTFIKYIMPSAGLSISHVNLPVEQFTTAANGVKLPLKMTLTGDVTITLSNKIGFTPRMLYSYMAGANELLMGSSGSYKIGSFDFPVKKLFAVAMVRVNPARNIDAFIVGGGSELEKFSLELTYDFNISPLWTVTNFNGAFELSFIYTGGRRKQEGANRPCYFLY
jgi:type IX secretion system PorP/SprF family membrane protein